MTTKDTSNDAGNQRHVEQRKKAHRARCTRPQEAVRSIAGDEHGQLCLADPMRESGAPEHVSGGQNVFAAMLGHGGRGQ